MKKLKWENILLSLVSVIIGVLCVCFPQASSQILCKVIGWSSLVLGVIVLVTYLINMRVFAGRGFVISVILLVIGTYFLINSGIVQSIIVLLFGSYIVINSAFSVSDCIIGIREKINGLVPWLVISIITLLIGVLIMFIVFDKIMTVGGIIFIVEGIRNFIFTFVCSNKIKKAKKLLKIIEE